MALQGLFPIYSLHPYLLHCPRPVWRDVEDDNFSLVPKPFKIYDFSDSTKALLLSHLVYNTKFYFPYKMGFRWTTSLNFPVPWKDCGPPHPQRQWTSLSSLCLGCHICVVSRMLTASEIEGRLDEIVDLIEFSVLHTINSSLWNKSLLIGQKLFPSCWGQGLGWDQVEFTIWRYGNSL